MYIYMYIYVSIYQEQPPATNNQQQEPNHGPSSRTLIPPGSEEGMGQRSSPEQHQLRKSGDHDLENPQRTSFHLDGL